MILKSKSGRTNLGRKDSGRMEIRADNIKGGQILGRTNTHSLMIHD